MKHKGGKHKGGRHKETSADQDIQEGGVGEVVAFQKGAEHALVLRIP